VSEGPAPSQPSAPEQESVQVPAVVGQNEADASRTLTDAGLTPVPYQVYSDDVAKGTVIDQVPGAGATVAPGTEVGIAVSQGPRPEEGVDVPDVTGMSAEEASEAVLAAGLEPGQLEVPNEADAGTVFAQLPRAGKTVYPNSKVIMLVSTGPGEAALPKEPAEGGDSSE
jgi:beta-lactam-binding protein with PASTA domain